MDVFKTFKSIAIIVFFTVTSTLSARFFSNNPALIEDVNSGSVYTSSIKLLIFFCGFLFVFAISHDLINREIDLQTIRLLVTKVSRFDILFGKFVGVMTFWVFALTLSFSLVSLYAKEWFWKDYFTLIIFMVFVVSFVVFLSTIITKPNVTMFLGILLGLVLPILGMVSVFTNKWYLVPFKYFLPYFYIIKAGWFLLIPLLIAIVLLYIGYYVLNRRDL